MAVEVNVTVVPEQTGLADAAIEILTGSNWFTVMIRILEVAGFPVEQDELEIIVQLTASLFAGM